MCCIDFRPICVTSLQRCYQLLISNILSRLWWHELLTLPHCWIFTFLILVLLIALWVRFFVFAHICRSTNTHKISLNERTFRRNLEKVAEGKFVVPSTKAYSNHLHFENLSNFALPSPRHLRHLIGWLLSLTHSLKTSMSNPIRSLCQSNHLIGFLPPTL